MLGEELKAKGGQPVDPDEVFEDKDDYNPNPDDMPESEIVEKAKQVLPVADEAQEEEKEVEPDDKGAGEDIADSGTPDKAEEKEEGDEETKGEEEVPPTVSREEYEELEKKRRGFQSAYDKAMKENERLLNIVQTILGVDGANGGQEVPTSDGKSIQDFMPEGVEYDPYEANDPSTESFKAMEQYRQYKEELKNQTMVQKLNDYLAQQKIETQYDVLRETEGLDDETMQDFKAFVESGNNTVRDLYEYYQFKKHGISSIVKKETDKIFNKIEKNSKKVKSIGAKPQTAEPGMDEDLKALNDIFGD